MPNDANHIDASQLQNLVDRLAADDAFRARLIADPVATLQEEGIALDAADLIPNGLPAKEYFVGLARWMRSQASPQGTEGAAAAGFNLYAPAAAQLYAPAPATASAQLYGPAAAASLYGPAASLYAPAQATGSSLYGPAASLYGPAALSLSDEKDEK